MTCMSPRHPRYCGFTLVELLVVIGIIGLLIALLLPSLSLAREHANQVKCLATLRSIGMAAQFHLNEHRGFYPCAGWEWNPDGGVVDPTGMGDAAMTRYDYYTDEGIQRPMPITAALASSLGLTIHTDSREALTADLRSESIRRLFRCPSQEVIDSGWSQHASDGWFAPEEFSSYAFNEALLGRRDRDPDVRPYPCGQSAAVHAPSEVFFAMDGRLRDAVTDRCFLVFDYGPNDTVQDFQTKMQQGTLGKELIDPWRHRQRLNVLFVDGHAATFGIEPGDLDQIGVSKGLN
jgi:prepilin-type processing-associated H-X9-DG protein/prepilin-type N-terminal cleavage/methylation domain-containing protein